MILNRSQVAALAVAGFVVISAAPRAASAKPPSYATSGETITGTIASVQNINHIFVADDRGFTDDVTLRSGAEVLSAGLHLAPGVRVTITGASAGPTFSATRISTGGQGYGTAGSATVVPDALPPAYAPTSVYYAAPSYYFYQPYPSLDFRFGSGYGPFYRGYGFGYRPYYRGYGFGYGPYYRGYGFGYGPYYRGYGFGYGPYYRGYGFGYGPYRGYGFGPFNRGYGFGFRSFSGGFGSLRGHGWFGAYGHFR